MGPNQWRKRHSAPRQPRILSLERLEARCQPAVVGGLGLEVREYFAYTAVGFSGPTDMAFGQGGLFGGDLYFTDSGAQRVYALRDATNDHDAADPGEGTLLYQFPNSGVVRPVSLLFGSGTSAWGNELYLIDDGVDKAFRVSDDSGSLVISPLTTFPNVGPLPTPAGAAFSADGQFMLVNDCQGFTFIGAGSDGRVYRISSSGVISIWATGGNLPDGLWDNNSRAATTSDGWFTVGHNGIRTSGGPSQIVQFRDNNGDGDALDVGEGRILVGSNVLGLNKKVFAFDSQDVLYVASTTNLGIAKVFRLEDLNQDGDYFDTAANAFDAGESTIVLNGIQGDISSLRVGPDGALYVGVREGTRGVVYLLADLQPPATPATPDLDSASDSGVSTADNITADNTPTFSGTAEAGSTIRLFSNVAGEIGTVVADAAGAWTITATALADGVHQITVTATDATGNVSAASTPLDVTIDTTAPTISAILDKNPGATGWYNLATGAPTATFTGSDGGSGVASVSGPYVFGEGLHLQATGTVTDVAGNSRTHSFFDLLVDLTAPGAPTITSPVDGMVTTLTTLTLTGNAEPGATIEVFASGSSLGTSVADDLGQWTFTTPTLAIGNYAFSAAATDAAGNQGSPSGAVRVVIENAYQPTPVPLTISAGQVNLNGSGALSITLLTTAAFDATTLDLATVELAGSKATGAALQDVNGDGRLDLVLQFRREDFVDEYAAALALDRADGRLDNTHQLVEIALTGKTKDGQDILGIATVDLFMTGKKLEQLLTQLDSRASRR